jgi:small subunit ribosomal protein S13e
LVTGLAPELPEDLYNLIKKVCTPEFHLSFFKLPAPTQPARRNRWLTRCPRTLQAVAVRKHLERNRKDRDAKYRLILIESRIHRLARYYRRVGNLPPNWRYESATASTLVA